MERTRQLTDRLRLPNPFWTNADLKLGFQHPLVLSEVLVCTGAISEYECTEDCEGCTGFCGVQPITREDGSVAYAWSCHRGGLNELSNDDSAVWGYDADRFAEIVNERIECEGVTKIGDGDMWRLGHSRISETQGREIVIKTRFVESDVESVPKLLGNQNAILLVGSLECEVADDQFRRRIFTFDQVVRFEDDGVVSFVLDEFVNRFAETVVPKKRGKRVDALARDKEIAEYLKRRFFEIMRIKEWADREKAIGKSKNVSAIGNALKPKIAKSTMTRYLEPKWKIGDPETIPQFWYNVVSKVDYFVVFSKLVESKPYPVESYDAFTLYGMLYKEFVALMIQAKKK